MQGRGERTVERRRDKRRAEEKTRGGQGKRVAEDRRGEEIAERIRANRSREKRR